MALADNALTTVATVEDELGISSGTETARLQRMINEASAIAESFAGRSFYRVAADVEKVRGTEGPFLFLSRKPINSITSIAYLGTTLSSGDYEIHGDGTSGIVYAVGGSWSRDGMIYNDISRTRSPGNERLSYTATYDGGWYTPKQEDGGDGTRALPYDIESAVISIVSYLRRGMGRDPSVVAEKLMDASVTFSSGGLDASGAGWLATEVPRAAGILNRYKSVVMR